MSCTSCQGDNNTPFSYNFNNTPSNPCSSDCGTTMDSACINYTGATLTCINVTSNNSLEYILQQMDTKICQSSAAPDYSGYDLSCILYDGSHPTNTQQFAEAISAYACATQTELDAYETSNNAALVTINNSITSINTPALTSCAAVNVSSSDNLHTVLSKILTSLCSTISAQDVSDANWNQCYTVSPVPTTIVEGFNTLIDQICTLTTNLENVLPTFNNTGSCLASPGATDSLTATISKIKTYLCALPTYGTSSTPLTCVSLTGDLQSDIEELATSLDTLIQTNINVVEDTSGLITYTPNSGSDACQGMKLVVNTEAVLNNHVAATTGDSSPAPLYDKLTAGANTTITTDGNTVTIASTNDDSKVKVSSTDSTTDYLINKLEGGTDATSGITISVSQDSSTSSYKAQILASVDPLQMATQILNTVMQDATLRTLFCQLVSVCNSSDVCEAASGLTVVHDTSGTYDAVAFDLTWTHGTGNVSQTAMYKRRGDATFQTINFTPANPLSPTASATVVEGLVPNIVYQFQIDSQCTTGSTTSSNVYEAIWFTCPDYTLNYPEGGVSITIPPLTTLDTYEYRLIRVSDSAVVASGSSTAGLGFYQFTYAGGGLSYKIEYRMLATVNGITVYSDSATYLNAWCNTGNFTLGTATTTTTTTTSSTTTTTTTLP